MSNLINVNDLIEGAKNKGVNFGKGNPYNRLRYYTKIGWLPHMIRKQTKNGNIEGHYPTWALDTLVKIENMKAKNISNEEIAKQIKTKNIINSLNIQKYQGKVVNILLIIFLLTILAIETNVISIGKTKDIKTMIGSPTPTVLLIDSGSAFVPKNAKYVTVTTNKVLSTYKINVTFNTDYSPATRYWITDVNPNKSFSIELDTPVGTDAEFSWFISN